MHGHCKLEFGLKREGVPSFRSAQGRLTTFALAQEAIFLSHSHNFGHNPVWNLGNETSKNLAALVDRHVGVSI